MIITSSQSEGTQTHQHIRVLIMMLVDSGIKKRKTKTKHTYDVMNKINLNYYVIYKDRFARITCKKSYGVCSQWPKDLEGLPQAKHVVLGLFLYWSRMCSACQTCTTGFDPGTGQTSMDVAFPNLVGGNAKMNYVLEFQCLAQSPQHSYNYGQPLKCSK